MQNIKAEDKLLRARVRLMTRHPFYSFVATRMSFYETEMKGGPQTAFTDGRDMYWYREFIDSLTEAETVGLICHEVMHCCWLHPLRLGARDPKLWNIACDIAINDMLIDGGLKLPKNGIFGPQFAKYKGWTADAIYTDLMKNSFKMKVKFPGQKGKGDGEGDGEGGDGEIEVWGGFIPPTKEDGSALSKDEITQIEEEMKQTVIAAAEFAKSRGNLPGGLEGLIKAAGKPTVNWQAYIQEFIKGNRPDDYSWVRPNRKMMVNHGIYMPRIRFQGAGNGVLSIDTSGSVSDDELRRFIVEITGIIEMCNPDRLIIIQHDAAIQRIDEWEAGMDFSELAIKGRGGTCIQPTFRHVDKMDEEIHWMIVFSDMEIGDWPPPAKWPDYPVLLCGTGPDTSPRGAGATYIPVKKAL